MLLPGKMNRRRFGQFLGVSAVSAVVPMAAHAERGLWPGIELLDQSGRIFKVTDLHAPLTLVKLWTHACPICVAEMGSLSVMAEALGPMNVEIVLLSHPEWWERDQAFAHSRRIPFRLATLASANPTIVHSTLLENGVYVVPRTMMIKGSTGNMTWQRGGRDWTSVSSLNELRAIMG